MCNKRGPILIWSTLVRMTPLLRDKQVVTCLFLILFLTYQFVFFNLLRSAATDGFKVLFLGRIDSQHGQKVVALLMSNEQANWLGSHPTRQMNGTLQRHTWESTSKDTMKQTQRRPFTSANLHVWSASISYLCAAHSSSQFSPGLKTNNAGPISYRQRTRYVNDNDIAQQSTTSTYVNTAIEKSYLMKKSRWFLTVDHEKRTKLERKWLKCMKNNCLLYFFLLSVIKYMV